MSTAARLILDTAAGRVFVKGVSPDAGELTRERLALGAALATFVTALSPPLLFRVQAAGWDITGWPALPGRPADLRQGSADIPRLARVLTELGAIAAPDDVPMRSVRQDWDRFADNPALLDGNCLVHTDPHGGNFIVDGDRGWLLDWGWAMRGPAWISAQRFILFLMEAGWKPYDAEQATPPCPPGQAPRQASSPSTPSPATQAGKGHSAGSRATTDSGAGSASPARGLPTAKVARASSPKTTRAEPSRVPPEMSAGHGMPDARRRWTC